MNFHKLFSLITVLISLSFYSCNPYKKAQGYILDGKYDYAIEHLTRKYKKGVKDKYKKELIHTLKEAYTKGNETDLETIRQVEFSKDHFQKKQKTFFSFSNIVERQNILKPLLPIAIHGKSVEFEMVDYSKQLNESKWSYAGAINEVGLNFMKKETKAGYRSGFDAFFELKNLYPNYKNIDENLNECEFKGTTFVFLNFRNSSDTYISNRTDHVLYPQNLINRINERKADWIQIHTEEELEVNYEFDIIYDIQDLFISSEKETVNSFVKEKNIFIKNKFVTDDNGQIKKDSLGRKETIAVYQLVSCNVEEVHRLKEANIVLKVTVFDNISDNIKSNFFENGVVFEDSKAIFTGDKRALEEDYVKSIDDKIKRFPSDDVMVEDCINPLKSDIENYIRKLLF